MTSIQAIRQTVEALVQFNDNPLLRLRRNGKDALTIGGPVGWGECSLSYFGKSDYNFSSIVELLQQNGGFFLQLTETNTHDHEWAGVKGALQKLREKIERYNQKGFRPRYESLRLKGFSDFTIPATVRTRVNNHQNCYLNLKGIHEKLITRRNLSASELVSFSDYLRGVQNQLLPKETISYINCLLELLDAYRMAERFSSYNSPFRFSNTGSSVGPYLVQFSEGLLESFLTFLRYVDNEYKRAGESEAGKPPYSEETIVSLRQKIAKFFKENRASDRHLRVLIFYSMLQQNRSIMDASNRAYEFIRREFDLILRHVDSSRNEDVKKQIEAELRLHQQDKNLPRLLSSSVRILSNFDEFLSQKNRLLKIILWTDTVHQFQDFYEYDLMHIADVLDTYQKRVLESKRWASLAELYALMYTFEFQVQILRVTIREGASEGVADRDLDAEKLLHRQGGKDPLSEHDAKWCEAFQLCFVNGEDFCVSDDKSPAASEE